MRGTLQRAATLAVLLAITVALAPAYYHFLHYRTLIGPGIPEKFDLTALNNKTVYFYVSSQGPAQLAPGDNFTALLSEIRAAGKVWNDVGTSDLRVAFGGLFSAGTPQSAPHIEVIFDEVPPGLIALGAPTLRADLTLGSAGPLVPINRSVLILNRDLSSRPSYSEGFFLTAVHEIGHTLGLQHTLTSAVMSTAVTRGVTKAAPLGSDDEAGISLLYPSSKFAAATGSISGQVTMSGQGVHMASVVALISGRPAVSALTNPDGSFRIDGLAPGQYFVYVHPLPPSFQPDLGPAETVLPLDSNGNQIPAGDWFETQFYPGTKDSQLANSVQVRAGANTSGIGFSVQRRTGAGLYGIATYSFPGQVAVRPAYLNPDNSARWFLLASAESGGLTSQAAPLAGLNVSVLGAPGMVQQLRAYASDSRFLQVDFSVPLFSLGPRHLVFNLNNDLYVLPSGMVIAPGQPPRISNLQPGLDGNGNLTVTVSGTNLNADTRIYFDGLQATRTGDSGAGSISVLPPVGASGHRAVVTALNSDGQSSLFLQGTAPPVFTYDLADPPSITVAPNSLPGGSEGMVEINGVNTAFVSGQTRLGFGSSDVTVKRLWVVGPNRLRAQVTVNSGTPAFTPLLVSVVTGFQVISQPLGFQALPPNPKLAVLGSALVNVTNPQAPVYPGVTAALPVSNFVPFNPIVTLNDLPLSNVLAGADQIVFTIPASLVPGPAVLRVLNGADTYSMLIDIAAAPPVVNSVAVNFTPIDGSRPAHPGEFVMVTFTLGDGSAVNRVLLTLNGIELPALATGLAAGSAYQSTFLLPLSLMPGQYTAVLSIDGRAAAPFTLPVRAQ